MNLKFMKNANLKNETLKGTAKIAGILETVASIIKISILMIFSENLMMVELVWSFCLC
jgi:hypothetical protein